MEGCGILRFDYTHLQKEVAIDWKNVGNTALRHVTSYSAWLNDPAFAILGILRKYMCNALSVSRYTVFWGVGDYIWYLYSKF